MVAPSQFETSPLGRIHHLTRISRSGWLPKVSKRRHFISKSCSTQQDVVVGWHGWNGSWASHSCKRLGFILQRSRRIIAVSLCIAHKVKGGVGRKGRDQSVERALMILRDAFLAGVCTTAALLQARTSVTSFIFPASAMLGNPGDSLSRVKSFLAASPVSQQRISR